MLTELLLASALGAFALASAISLRRRLAREEAPDLRAAIEAPARGLLRVMRRPAGLAKERPRVVVQGPKVRPVICQICLGRVKEGLEYARCSCGKVFHPVCLLRTGFCPYCDLPYGDEGLPPEVLVRPRVTEEQVAGRRAEIRMLWEAAGTRYCPACGAELQEGERGCPCGAIVVDEGQPFACPACGTEVPPDRMECPACRERFDAVEEPICPVCGRLVGPGQRICSCGGLAGDECPECGAHLGPDDRECPACGAAFEFV